MLIQHQIKNKTYCYWFIIYLFIHFFFVSFVFSVLHHGLRAIGDAYDVWLTFPSLLEMLKIPAWCRVDFPVLIGDVKDTSLMPHWLSRPYWRCKRYQPDATLTSPSLLEMYKIPAWCLIGDVHRWLPRPYWRCTRYQPDATLTSPSLLEMYKIPAWCHIDFPVLIGDVQDTSLMPHWLPRPYWRCTRYQPDATLTSPSLLEMYKIPAWCRVDFPVLIGDVQDNSLMPRWLSRPHKRCTTVERPYWYLEEILFTKCGKTDISEKQLYRYYKRSWCSSYFYPITCRL